MRAFWELDLCNQEYSKRCTFGGKQSRRNRNRDERVTRSRPPISRSYGLFISGRNAPIFCHALYPRSWDVQILLQEKLSHWRRSKVLYHSNSTGCGLSPWQRYSASRSETGKHTCRLRRIRETDRFWSSESLREFIRALRLCGNAAVHGAGDLQWGEPRVWCRLVGRRRSYLWVAFWQCSLLHSAWKLEDGLKNHVSKACFSGQVAIPKTQVLSWGGRSHSKVVEKGLKIATWRKRRLSRGPEASLVCEYSIRGTTAEKDSCLF